MRRILSCATAKQDRCLIWYLLINLPAFSYALEIGKDQLIPFCLNVF